MEYFELPNCCIAFNAKVGSTAIASAIVQKYYPKILEEVLDRYERTYSQFTPEFLASLPEAFQEMFARQKLDSKAFWQMICPRTKTPTKPILLAVREPVARFVSTVAYLQLNVEDALNSLETDNKILCEKCMVRLSRNTHFLHQYPLAENAKCYRFPEDLERFCKDAELDYPLPVVNEGKFAKPILTEDQILRVKKYYEKDVELFSRLKTS